MGLGYYRKRHELERKQVMGRLAAVETLGILDRNVEQTGAEDRTAALARLKKLLGGTVGDDTAKDYLDVLIGHLRKSEVNINFKANEFFASKPADKYATKFEVMRKTGAPMGNTRDDTEEKMFHYGSTTTGGSTDPGLTAAVGRVTTLGPMASADFAGIIRPRYCSLNFSSLKDGFGAQWGRSHFKLSDRLKANMSFVHTDSFDLNNGKSTPQSVQRQVATYHNMTRLICNMADVMFEMLVDAASGQFQPGQTHQAAKNKYRFGSTLYIEAQCHAEILFGRDVDEIRICQTEIAGDATATKNLDKFAAKHKISKTVFT